MSYATIPMVSYKSGSEITKLRAILEAARGARARAVRVAVMGDSRSTYLAQGNNLISMYNVGWWQHYRNCPEMPLQDGVNVGDSVHQTPSTGPWGCAAFSYGAAGTARTADRCLRGFEGSVGQIPEIAIAAGGTVFNVQHDGYQAVIPVAQVPREYEYFQRSGMKAEVFIPRLLTNHDTLEWWNAHSVTSPVAPFNFFAPAFGTLAATGTIDITTAVGAEGPVLSFLTPAYTHGLTPTEANLHSNYGQFQFGAETSSGAAIELMGVVMRSAITRGITYSGFGTGGIKAEDYLTGRENSAASLSAFAPDIILWRLGVNDTATAANYKTFMTTNLTWGATVTNYDGAAPLQIVESDHDCGTGSLGTTHAVFDTYADKLHELALATNNVIFFNMRKRLEDRYGWKEGSALTTYITDGGSHPNALGCATIAKEHIQFLLETASDGGFRDIYLSNQAALVGLQGL